MVWFLTLLACASRPAGPPPVWSEGSHDLEGSPGMYGFSWVDDRTLAAMPRPSGDDLAWIAAEGVELLVTATESPLDPALLAEVGLDSLHLPIDDYQPPTPEQAILFAQTVEERAAQGSPVGVHCLAGRGRSGTLSAIWLVHTGLTAQDAIDQVRALRPGSIETAAQEQSVFDYEAWLSEG